jgi:hypothetical protein
MSRKKLLVNKVTVGADIEVFLQDRDTEEIVSAEGIIQGSKDAPFQFKDGGFATSLDNVMAEFNIPPAKDADEFHRNISEALSYIESTIPKRLKPLAVPSAYIDPRWLNTENAQMFGCEPDYNAWIFGEINEKPNANTNLRSCGGHIHIGYEKPNNMLSMQLIRVMDIFIGLPSIIQEPDNERKMLYGKAGAYRLKNYGAEYRTVSNYYLQSASLTKWAFNNTLSAVEFVNQENPISGEESKAIQAAINFNDKPLAQTLCTYFGVKLAS